jgi:acetyl esterase
MSSTITDPEVLAFIAKTESLYPADTVDFSIEDQRRVYDQMGAAFQVEYPEGVTSEDGIFDGPGGSLKFRRYLPENAGVNRVLYFHGGGFVVGGLESHDDVCAEISKACGIEVVSVDYRLCPEHPHPAAYDDTVAAVLRFGDKPLILCGDSAGGNLVAAVSLSHRERIKAQVLIYPGLGGNALNLPSYSERAEAPMLNTKELAFYAEVRAGGPPPLDDPTFMPLAEKDYSGVPPCFVSSAEHDPLRDDGPEWAARLRAAGVWAEAVVEPELPHGHLRARHMSTRAAEAFQRITDTISGFCEGTR